VLHHHRVLSQALKQAVRWQLIPRNVADAVEPPRPTPVEIKPIDEAQAAWLIDAAEGTRLQIPILLATVTGMRRGEILALQWGDTNLESGTVSVRRSLIETSEDVIFKEPKSRQGRPQFRCRQLQLRCFVHISSRKLATRLHSGLTTKIAI